MIEIVRFSETGFEPVKQTSHLATLNYWQNKEYLGFNHRDFVKHTKAIGLGSNLKNIHKDYEKHVYGFWAFLFEPPQNIIDVYLSHRPYFNYEDHKHIMEISEDTIVYEGGNIFNNKHFMPIKEAYELNRSYQIYIPCF
jgi:hypothetical protein